MTSFELLETLALTDGALRDAPAHLARMHRAAAHFGYPWHEAQVTACLDRLRAAHAAGTWRVRLLLDAQGQARAEAFAPTAPGVFDTLLWNREGEITECTRGNIALRLDGRWVTPPLHCGLLDGIGRARRLREGQLTEAVVRVDELPRVEALAFVNSLRGWLDADLVDDNVP